MGIHISTIFTHTMELIKNTCLTDLHKELGAQMSPFGGFDMPIQYTSIVEEHNAVRTRCGIFDVSHMGEVMITGPQATEYVNHIFTNDVTGAETGKCLYGMMLNDKGGVVDDLLVYVKGKESYLLVINASNILKDFTWMVHHAQDFDVRVDNISDEVGEIAVQGPDSEAVLRDVLGIDASDLAFYTFKEITIGDRRLLVSRTGYTGEDGFEIYADRPNTRIIWKNLIESGRVVPCGLGCRDTLRFEVALPLYGDELGDDITPLEAGLGIFVKFDKPEFIGKDALLEQKAQGVKRKIVGLEILDRAIARHGTEVLNAEGEVVGEVTTGYRGISVDKSLAMAMVNIDYAAQGTPLQVKVRKKVFPAVVVPKKFYKKSYKK